MEPLIRGPAAQRHASCAPAAERSRRRNGHCYFWVHTLYYSLYSSNVRVYYPSTVQYSFSEYPFELLIVCVLNTHSGREVNARYSQERVSVWRLCWLAVGRVAGAAQRRLRAVRFSDHLSGRLGARGRAPLRVAAAARLPRGGGRVAHGGGALGDAAQRELRVEHVRSVREQPSRRLAARARQLERERFGGTDRTRASRWQRDYLLVLLVQCVCECALLCGVRGDRKRRLLVV